MDIAQWKHSLLLNVVTNGKTPPATATTTAVVTPTTPTSNGASKMEKNGWVDAVVTQTSPSSPRSVSKPKKKNRWEVAADLMFKKKEKQRNLDIAKSVQGTGKAKFDGHVQRMILGRIKSRSKKEIVFEIC